MKCRYLSLLPSVGLAALLPAIPAWAQSAPPLGALQQFAILGSTTVSATGTAVIPNGDVGVSPGTTITGNIIVAPGFAIRTPNTSPWDASLLMNARAAAFDASANLLSQGPGLLIAPELGGTTRPPSVYTFTANATVAAGTTFTLDAQGNPNAVWVFLVPGTITANAGSNVVLLNGVGNPCNVFWRVGGTASLNGLNFPGTVIAGAAGVASVTLGDGANLFGRAVSLTAAVAMPGTGQTVGGCSGAPPPPPDCEVPSGPNLDTFVKSDSPDPVTVGTNLTYPLTFDLQNLGQTACIRWNDPLPPLTTFVSLTAPAPWVCTTPPVGTNGTVTCTHATFLSSSDVFTLVVNVDPAAIGTLTNVATLTTATAGTCLGVQQPLCTAAEDTAVVVPATLLTIEVE